MINFGRFEFNELPDFHAVHEKTVIFRYFIKFSALKTQINCLSNFFLQNVYVDMCDAIYKEKEELIAKNYALKSEKTEKKPLIENVRLVIIQKL